MVYSLADNSNAFLKHRRKKRDHTKVNRQKLWKSTKKKKGRNGQYYILYLGKSRKVLIC